MWGKIQEQAFITVKNALNSKNIKWLIVRNYEGLPEFNRSKDVDIAISHSDFKKVSHIIFDALKSIGFEYFFRIKYQYAWCNTFFCLKNGRVESIKIDLVDGFVWRGAQIVRFKDIYERKENYKDFYVCSRLDDGFMLLIKPLMTGGFIKQKYVSDIVDSFNSNKKCFENLYYRTFGKSVSKKTFGFVENSDFEKLVKYKRKLCLKSWSRCFFKKPFSTFWKLIVHFALEIGRVFVRKKGTMVSVVGPDGVGKTTFLTLFREGLADVCVSDEQSIEIVHFRPNMLPNLKKAFSGKKYDESKEDFENPHRGGKTNPLSSLIRLFYYWNDYVWGYFIKIKKKCRHSGKVIFDRYSSDYLVDPERSRVFLPYFIRKLFFVTTPQPDLTFVLSCDPNIIYERKKELTMEEIKLILERYNKECSKNKRFVLLDASKTPDEIVSDALILYTKKLLKRIK